MAGGVAARGADRAARRAYSVTLTATPDARETFNGGVFLSVLYADGAWIATSGAESILIHP